MSPYEVELLVHIDSCFDFVSFEKTTHLRGTLCRLSMKHFIKCQTTDTYIPDDLKAWKTTKLGQAICEQIYDVDENDIRFCGECGQVLSIE